MFNDINKDYKFLADLRSGVLDQSQDLWEARLFKWINKLVTNDEIDPNKISKFRATSALLSEVPRNPYLDKTFKKHIYEYLRFPGYKKTCFHNFEKLCHDDSLIWESFSQVGEPIYYESDGKKFNERFLRHLRTVSIIEKNISLKSGSIVVDIGGGYGQFIAMMHYKFDSAKKILIDFPEQLLVASYFLKKSFPDAKINTIRSCYEKNISITSMLKNNDFVLIPVDQLHLLNDIEVDLVCNFSSFGEMSVDNFTGYMSGSLISNAKYFFTVNRLDSFPTYTNGISILDYNLDRYKAIHFQVSPVWDFYFESFSPYLLKKKAFNSRNFEYLGKLI